MSSFISALGKAYSNAGGWDRIGRVALGVANVSAVAVTVMGAVFKPTGKALLSEIVSDAAVHITTALTLRYKWAVGPAVIANASRVIILACSLSALPKEAVYADLALHVFNILSPFVLKLADS